MSEGERSWKMPHAKNGVGKLSFIYYRGAVHEKKDRVSNFITDTFLTLV